MARTASAALVARVDLSGSPRSSGQARNATRQILNEWDVPASAIDDALVVVSELVTNAIRHAGTSSTLEMELSHSREWLRVALRDGSSAPPMPRVADPTAEDGRGMAIMSALSDRWGIEPYDGGKRVWLEIDLVRSDQSRYVGSAAG